MKIRDYKILVYWSKEYDTYIARCIEIPACMSYGENPEIALRETYKAIEDHLEYRKELELNEYGTATRNGRVESRDRLPEGED